MADHVWNLRSRRCFEIIETCLAAARERFGLRVIEFTVLGNHLHLVVEADNDEALSRGMQGLNIRIAKAAQSADGQKRRRLRRPLPLAPFAQPTELVNAIAYVLGNAAHHYGESGEDRFLAKLRRAAPAHDSFPPSDLAPAVRVAASEDRAAVARGEQLAAAVDAVAS